MLVLVCAIGVLMAAVTVALKRPTAVFGLTVSAVALLSGAYFPLELLPGPLESLGELLPFTWGIDSLRATLLGGELEPAALLGLFAVGGILLVLTTATFAAAVNRARRAGTLAEY